MAACGLRGALSATASGSPPKNVARLARMVARAWTTPARPLVPTQVSIRWPHPAPTESDPTLFEATRLLGVATSFVRPMVSTPALSQATEHVSLSSVYVATRSVAQRTCAGCAAAAARLGRQEPDKQGEQL